MQVKVQVITLRDDGEESLQEVACVERVALHTGQSWLIDCGQ